MAACVCNVLVGLGVQDLLHDHVILRSVHEVADRDDSCAGSGLSCALNQILVADYELNASGNFGYGVVGNLDVSKTLRLELLLKDCSAHCGGAHACVASKYDSVKSSEVNFAAVCGCSVCALGSSLHVAHLALCILKACTGVGHLHDRRSDQEGNCGADQEAEAVRLWEQLPAVPGWNREMQGLQGRR